jgi:hypothetical protein
MASPPWTLPEGVEDIVLAEIICCLSSGEGFSKTGPFREQFAHAYRIFASCIARQSLSQLSPNYSALIRAQFVNVGTISRLKKMFSGYGGVLLF